MNRWFSALVVVLSLAMGMACTAPAPCDKGLEYPQARMGDVVDDCHGTQVADPYRWLEDPDSQETRQWIEAENALTSAYLEAIPQRTAIEQRLTELWNYERYGTPYKQGGRYFFDRNDGLQPQSILYVMDSLDGEPRVLIDPNTLSEDGTVALNEVNPSPDGRWLAYSISNAGSDWQEWRVRDVNTGADLDDHLMWSKFSEAVWMRDSSGFFYNRYDEPAEGDELEAVNYYQKVFLHRLGSPQGEDELVYWRPDEKEWGFRAAVSDDGDYLVLAVTKGTGEEEIILVKRLRRPDSEVVELIPEFEASFDFLANDGTVLYFLTTSGAARGRIVAIDLARPERAAWREVVAEGEDTLRSVAVVHDTFVAHYIEDAHSRLQLLGMDGTVKNEVQLPGLGSVRGLGGNRDDSETFFSFTNFTTPTTIYHLDLASGDATVFRQPEVAFDPADYTVEQVFFASNDGVEVPMFISHKKDLAMDGSAPAILYGYGGFNINLLPRFSVSNLAWMEMGGIYAQPSLRGGGEYGDEWHEAGMLANKQNTFDDFIAAAEWLIANSRTSKERLAISGASNGGLLVGAVLNQRPDLFGAALPDVGVMDMLRFHKFTIGWAWVSDYGSPDDPEMFPVLRAYSPLHNIQEGAEYPATMVFTADHDDRVVPGHSFKYTATLQAAQGGSAPILIRIETRAGHGAGMPTSKRIAEAADRLAFLTKVFGM